MTKKAKATQKKIMIADDDPAIVEATSLILEDCGYTVSSTVNGATVYKMVEDLPDLLLLDIWMSGQDGREICKYLKTNPKTKHIPVIMISASRDIIDSVQKAGADDFLPKPFNLSDLTDKIEKHIGKPQAR